MARKFANFFATKLKNDIDAAQTSIALETLPRDKDNVIIDAGRIVVEARNADKREIIKYTGVDVGTTTITGCTRGDGRTTATTHSKGAITEVNVTGEDLTEIYDYFDTFTNTYPMKSLYDNAIINASCAVAQRLTAPTLSTTYQYGKVDRFAAKATGTAVSAGTITQLTAPNVTTFGQSLQIAAATITGAGIVYLRYRMEAKDAVMFKNQPASFGCLVRQNTGVSINAKVFINKPTALDNFASTTNVATSGNIAVAHNTNTVVKLENINAGNLGDVSFGLEIEIQLTVGAVTTKNFEFGNFVFNKGALLAPFMPKFYADELRACLRYFYPVVYNASGYYSTLGSAYIGGGQSWIGIPLAVPMRATPTVVLTNVGVRYGGSDFGSSFSAITQQSAGNLVMQVNSGGTGNGNSGTGWISPGGNFTLESEL